MPDTPQTESYFLNTVFPDNAPAGSITPALLRQLIVSTLNVVPAVVSAAGTNFVSATVLTSQINVVTTVGNLAGVVATAGYTMIINRGLNTLYVYPYSTSASLENFSPGAPVAINVGDSAEVIMTSTTQGYVR